MEIRAFRPKDYLKVVSWWGEHKWPIIPLEALPMTGFIIDDLAVGWLYHTEVPIAIMEWLTVNPNAEKMARREALDMIIEELSLSAKEAGFMQIFTSIKHPGLLERLKNHKFNVTDEGMTNLIRSLD